MGGLAVRAEWLKARVADGGGAAQAARQGRRPYQASVWNRGPEPRGHAEVGGDEGFHEQGRHGHVNGRAQEDGSGDEPA